MLLYDIYLFVALSKSSFTLATSGPSIAIYITETFRSRIHHICIRNSSSVITTKAHNAKLDYSFIGFLAKWRQGFFNGMGQGRNPRRKRALWVTEQGREMRRRASESPRAFLGGKRIGNGAMLFMLNIRHPMTGIMAMGTCSWPAAMAEGGYRRCEWALGRTREFSLHFPLFVIPAGSLDSSGTERDEMDTRFTKALSHFWVPNDFLLPFPFPHAYPYIRTAFEHHVCRLP